MNPTEPTSPTGHTAPAQPTSPSGHTAPAQPTSPSGHTEPMEATEPMPAPRPSGGTSPAPPVPGPPSGAGSFAEPPVHRPARAQEHPARVSTMVWGLLTIVVGLVAMAVATGRQVDLEIALISIFLLAGLGLLIGAGWSAWQRSAAERRQREAPWEGGRPHGR